MTAFVRGTNLGQSLGRATRRGFTLVELVIVVVIISIFSALATPAIVKQLRDRKLVEAGQQIAGVYRQARMRAMGRGSAVLVRFGSGGYSVFEAQMGSRQSNPACAALPFSSCTNNSWALADQRRLVDGYSPAAAGMMKDLVLGMLGGSTAETSVAALDVCFTPMGRVFSRESDNDADPFQPMASAYLATISAANLGRERRVVILPNGTARPAAL
jgi:prepilin-type N-terminal cleavage/methylation domain-containing protein